MTDDNSSQMYRDMDAVDYEALESNLYHGCIAATFIVNLYETALNTILGRRLYCTEEEIFKTSHGVKLQLICTMLGVDIDTIKSDHSYALLQSIVKLRNDITHFKSNDLGTGTFISEDAVIPMSKSKTAIGKMFTKSYMQKHYDGILCLLKLICDKCGFVLNKDCEVLDSDGRDSACEFILSRDAYIEQDIENENLSQ